MWNAPHDAPTILTPSASGVRLALSAKDLLQRYRDEVSVSEMTHNFDLDLGAHSSMGGHAGGKNGNGLGGLNEFG